MKILFCGLRYEYGKKEVGDSFEYVNFYKTLEQMNDVQSSFFATDEGLQLEKRDELNKKFIQIVKETKPDLLFCFLFTEELKKEAVEYITKNTRTKTFNWFADDHWRFPVYSKYWAPLFTAVSTTDSRAVEKYKKIGVSVIKTQWAARHIKCQISNIKIEKQPEITFVGKNYGNRGEYIKALKEAGVSVAGYGKGWGGGFVSNEEMLNIFTNSKINLNFTESYFNWPRQMARLFVKKELGNLKLNIHHPISNIQSLTGAMRRQIKARIFEIPAAGGFLLTGDADNLRTYYEDGREIVIFKDKKDLIEKCQYYLTHEEERKAIAKVGQERTFKEHTYEKRFEEIFKQII